MERLTKWEGKTEDGKPRAVLVKRDGAFISIFLEAVAKLAQYEDAEEQGRLSVLPCRVGDTVYYIKTLQNGADTKVIDQDTVKRIILDGIDNQIVISYGHAFMMCDFNRLLFLSREEAEKTLEGMK